MARAERKPVRPARTRPARVRPIVWAGAASAIAAAILVLLLVRSRSEAPVTLTTFQAPPEPPRDSITFADFVGSESCAGCHAAEYAAWSKSTHGRAGQAPPRDLVMRRFDGTPIRFRDATVQPTISKGRYEFVVDWFDRTDRYPIEGVIGGGHMVGGGTQGFVWRHPDGSLRLLPFEITGSDSTWFCSTGTRAERGWVRITPSMSIADCGDWPPVRMLGSSARLASCQECHGSQIEVVGGSRPNETRLASLSINCESCHGPGRRHVALVRAPTRSAEIGMKALATLSRDSSMDLCLRCHALKADVRRGYLPGRAFDERYSLKIPLLDGDELLADGRTRLFAYQQGHLYSDCYLSGSMTCVDCHDPHSQQYRDITGNRLASRFADAQCTDCHPSKTRQVEQHTRHAANSAGSRCVSCHMPFVQESAVGKEIRFTRSDHTISIPRVQLDARLGVVNACQTCHQDRSVEQLTQDTRRLWGELKPLRPIVASLLERDRLEDFEAIILAADTTHRMAYFDALSRYLVRLDLDAQSLPRKLRRRMEQLTYSHDDDMAALALAILHFDAGHEPRTRAFLAQRLGTLGARELSVRQRWAIALGQRGDALRERARPADAVAVYERALELQPNDVALLQALGLARLNSGDAAGASETLRHAIANEPGNSLVLVNYGRARAAAGDEAGAAAAYRQATEVNPYDALAFFNLANTSLRAGQPEDAARLYRRAIELDVSLAPAHFNLARALLLQDRKEAALSALRSGLVFDPNQAEARAAAEQLEAEIRRR
jgi:tetratricopeptide (TPR) repeat protein